MQVTAKNIGSQGVDGLARRTTRGIRKESAGQSCDISKIDSISRAGWLWALALGTDVAFRRARPRAGV